MNYLKKIHDFINDDRIIKSLEKETIVNHKIKLITKIKDENKKIKCLSKLTEDWSKIEVIRTLSDEEKKINALKYLNNISARLEVIKNLKNDDKKLECMNMLTETWSKAEILKTIIDDDKKISVLNYLNDEWMRLYVIKTLKSDDKKIKCLNNIQNDDIKTEIIKMLDDNNKEKHLNQLSKAYNKYQVILTFKYPEKIFQTLNDNIDIYKLNIYSFISDMYNMNVLDKVKTIYPNLINEFLEYYEISANKDNLIGLIKKYGYIVFFFLANDNNLLKLINTDKESFQKIMAIFDNKKSCQLSMKDVDNIIFALLHREFRFSNKDTITIFGLLEQLIENKNIFELKKVLNEINDFYNVNEILEKNEINYDDFIKGLLNKEYINILHEITDNYIDLKRNEYIVENQQKVKTNLNLKISYEKKYLIDKLLECDINKIYDLIIKIDQKYLSKEELELINNKELLISAIKFQKKPNNYNGIDIKSKLRHLNQIFNKLYINQELDYLSEDDKKIVYEVKSTKSEEYLRIMSELDITIIKDKILNSELYDKLLNIIQKYHLLGWNDMFKPLLEKADLEFNSHSIVIMINYFYIFYPALEKKVEKGVLKEIRLVTLIDEVVTYSSSSIKYKCLLGREDYNIFVTNPNPNSAPVSKESRFESLFELMKKAIERKYITIPPINKNVIVNNKKINICVNSFLDPINFTYGERTGACMRLGGTGESLFRFCLTNENGFHICFKSDNNDFISRVSGFRNGNTVFLNQLRYSVNENYNNDDLYIAIKIVANLLVELTKESYYPIKNVVISSGYVMEKYFVENKNLDIDPLETLEFFYSDINRKNAIYLEENDNIKLGKNNTQKYRVPRKRMQYFTGYKEIEESIQQMYLFNALIKGKNIHDIEPCDDELTRNVSRLFVGEDWLVGYNKNNECIIRYILERDKYQIEEAQKEMNFILEQHNIIANNKKKTR